MTPDHRNVLLEAVYVLDHLVWFYRSEIDRSPGALLTSTDMCLSDFANRSASLARTLLDEDTGSQRAKQPQFKPPSPSYRARLDAAIRARREALKQHAAAAASSTPEPAPRPPDDQRPDAGTSTSGQDDPSHDSDPGGSGLPPDDGHPTDGGTRSRSRMRPR